MGKARSKAQKRKDRRFRARERTRSGSDAPGGDSAAGVDANPAVRTPSRSRSKTPPGRVARSPTPLPAARRENRLAAAGKAEYSTKGKVAFSDSQNTRITMDGAAPVAAADAKVETGKGGGKAGGLQGAPPGQKGQTPKGKGKGKGKSKKGKGKGRKGGFFQNWLPKGKGKGKSPWKGKQQR